MLRLDRRTPEQIEALIRWVQDDEFWMANVLSMDSVRKNFDKLELKQRANGHSRSAQESQRFRDSLGPEWREAQ